MNNKTVEEWLLSFKQESKINLGLERTHQVAKRLDLLTFGCPVVTVAGTNGKGSTVAMIEALAFQAGLSVGSFTSPHLFCYNERICIDRKPVSDTAICLAFSVIDKARDAIELSYFEWTTLAALYLFKQQGLDLVILEVGLGGRLDATNVVDADIAVITGIDIDHVNVLGDNKEVIGAEKAGIFKANKCAVIGCLSPPNSVLQKAKEKQMRVYQANRDFAVQKRKEDWDYVSTDENYTGLSMPPLQLSNAAAAICVAKQLNLPLSHQLINQAFSRLQLKARGEKKWRDSILHIFDVAHNPQAFLALKQQVALLDKKRVLLVFSMLQRKDIQTCLKIMQPIVDDWYIAPLATHEGLRQAELVAAMEKVNISSYHCVKNMLQAYKAAFLAATRDDIIVICGSFYAIAEVYEWIDNLSLLEKGEING